MRTAPDGIFRLTVRGGHDRRLGPLGNFVRCRQVRLDGFTVTSLPGWGMHLFDCDGDTVTDLRIRGRPDGPNTDGIVINARRNVRAMPCDVGSGDEATPVKGANAGPVARMGIICRNTPLGGKVKRFYPIAVGKGPGGLN